MIPRGRKFEVGRQACQHVEFLVLARRRDGDEGFVAECGLRRPEAPWGGETRITRRAEQGLFRAESRANRQVVAGVGGREKGREDEPDEQGREGRAHPAMDARRGGKDACVCRTRRRRGRVMPLDAA